MIPSFIFQIWLFGLLSFGIFTGAVYLAKEWPDPSWGCNAAAQQSVAGQNIAEQISDARLVTLKPANI